MMGRDYLPRDEAGLLRWMRAFAHGIDAQPSIYMLGPAEAAAIVQTVGRFAAALGVATTPATRTSPTVRDKDAARHSAEQLCRRYYSLIKASAGVSDGAKLAIGVRPVNGARRRIGCPMTSPVLDILGATPHCHMLKYHDTMTPDGRSKPFGAALLQLMVAVGEEPAPPGGAEAAARVGAVVRLVGQFVENPVTVQFDHADDRKKATYYGRWMSRRGETGPWSLPVSMTIAA